MKTFMILICCCMLFLTGCPLGQISVDFPNPLTWNGEDPDGVINDSIEAPPAPPPGPA